MTQRQTKTPAQRAQEALDVADRRVKRLKDEDEKLRAARVRVGEELAAAEKRRDYLAANPDLPRAQVPDAAS